MMSKTNLSYDVCVFSSQGELRQMTFIMGDANAAKDHCAPHQHMCEPLKGHSFLEMESSTEVQLWTWCT